MLTPLLHSLFEQRSCTDCVLKPICKPAVVRPDDIEQLSNFVVPRRSVPAGHRIFEQGGKVRSLFVSQAGAVKTETLSSDGNIQVLGFHFPGELMGLEAMAAGTFRASAVTLEPGVICEIPLTALDVAAGRRPELQTHLLQALGSCLSSQQDHVELLAMRQADERIAMFLVGLLERSEAVSGAEEEVIHLAMGRSDLGSYLCMTIETVSRSLSALRDDGILNVHGRRLVVVDRARLFAKAGVPMSRVTRSA
jgi:CRP/FNR family transcriptional regulator